MKTTPLTPNEIRFILAVDATWTVLRQPVLTKIYHDEWAIGNGSFGIGSVSLRRREKKYNNLNNLKSTTIARETTYLALRNIISVMLESTMRRYKIIRKEVYKRLGKMSTMMAYADVAQDMGLTEETVRKIIRKINKWDMVPTKK